MEMTTMWVRLTIGKIKPGKMDEMRKIYYEEIVPVVKAQNGNVDIFLLEPVDAGDDIVSYNSWESQADGDAYEASGTYAEMVEKVRHTLTGQLKVKSYEVKK
jgi:quinol monooxygenase YgiN